MYLHRTMTESKMSSDIASPRAMSMMHEWTSVNGWSRSRPSTNEGHAKRVDVSGSRSQLSLRRSQTTMEKQQVYRPHRRKHCDSSTTDFIKHLESLNKETEAKLKDTMHVLAIHRSRSDLEYRDTPSPCFGNINANGLFRERSHMYLTKAQDLYQQNESTYHRNKREMKIGLAVVPRKGLIALQTTDTAVFNQQHTLRFERERTRPPFLLSEGGTGKSKSLIKRMDMLEHIKLGTKLLEDAEDMKLKDEEIAKFLGDYTILDLQSKLIEMTDRKSVRRHHTPKAKSEMGSQHKRSAPTGLEKSVTLPAIKTINPF